MGDSDDGYDKDYRRELRKLQIELVKFERHLIAKGEQVLVILEGRDAAGKDGTIKHIVEHLSPRETRVVALSKPSDKETTEWYFQRYVPHLPAGGEFVLFNRSWYNRAGVEPVMGFCTETEAEEFLNSAPTFEWLLVKSGIQIFKYYLDIDRKEQQRRLKSRLRDPLKQWKLSPIDKAAHKKWKEYSHARDNMLLRSHAPYAPWTIVKANRKHQSRLNLIRHLLSRVHYKKKDTKLLDFDPKIVFEFEEGRLHDGSLAK